MVYPTRGWLEYNVVEIRVFGAPNTVSNWHRPRRHALTSLAALAVGMVVGTTTPGHADTPGPFKLPTSYNFNGSVGLIDMPSGQSAPDAEISATVSHFGGMTRVTQSFQLTERIGASFRYARTENLNLAGFEDYYDRSFDFRFQLAKEGKIRPAIMIGLIDVAGTGLNASEYIAATKTLAPNLRVTAGLGWGRMGSYNPIGSPFGARPNLVIGTGGDFNPDQYFRGPMAGFAGVEWAPTDKIRLKAEYSSDAYLLEAEDRGLFQRKSPFNFGVEYQLSETTSLGAYSLYGSQIGAMLNIQYNPKRSAVSGSFGAAPLGVEPREGNPANFDTSWIEQPNAKAILLKNLERQLAVDDVILHSMDLGPTSVEVHIENKKFIAGPQAIGRTARALTRTMLPSVEEFRIVPVVDGLPTSTVILRRRDIETLVVAPNGAQRIWETAQIESGPAPTDAALIATPPTPKFTWGLKPFARVSLFDPNNPFAWAGGLALSADYRPRPGVIFSGEITQQLVGNLGNNPRISNSTIQHVRSDAPFYAETSGPKINKLSANYLFHPGADLYGRVSAGLLEQMFGGVSTELLWKPVNSRLALGVEANYVKQRDFEGLFGFQDYETFTGHVSAYYEMNNGFFAQLDVGQYLAGDKGATFTLKREFANGWKVGAFATITDVDAASFGEGSFDKGVMVEIPESWITGRPTRKTYEAVLRPLTRDGGARLDVDHRLYEKVRGYHRLNMETQWGKFWR